MDTLTWDDFRVFTEVARSGSYRRAAAKLKITEPTVCRRVRRLEAQLGAKLVSHVNGSGLLTAEGKRVLSHVDNAEYSLTQAAAVVERASAGVGECRILAGDGVATYWLPQFLARFVEVYPNIRPYIFAARDRYGQKPPLFDLRIQYVQTKEEDLVCVPLCSVHFALFATRRYAEQFGLPASEQDLSKHRLIDLFDDMKDVGLLEGWLGVGYQFVLASNSNGTLSEFVRYGGGIGILPTYAALMDSDALMVLPNKNFSMKLVLSYDRAAAKKTAVKTMIDFLRDIVFDADSMPWFADSFRKPAADWPSIYNRSLKRASSEVHIVNAVRGIKTADGR